MTWSYQNLDNETRKLMSNEVLHDAGAGTIYLSKRVNPSKDPDEDFTQEEWVGFLLEASLNHDTEWLKGKLRALYPLTPDYIIQRYCDDQFNRFYIRAVCQRAINLGINEVITYRAHSRLEPLSPEGEILDAKALLADLRENTATVPRLNVPNNPNTGISVRLP